jgi:hypothetical protein
VVAVGATSTLVLDADRERVWCMLINDDAQNNIYIRFIQDAVVGRGIRLNAGGGSYEMCHTCGNMFNGQVTAIHDGGAGTANLIVLEGKHGGPQ